MNKAKTLIYFGAHPDDETFGMGSTLAQYIIAGVKVYYVCSTHGEAGTVDPEFMKGFASIADVRRAEMKCAAQALGLADVIYLGYRDSGMQGSEDNKNPASLAMAPLDAVAGLMVKIIRELKPDVVITHDAGVMVILTTSPPTMLSSGHSTQPTTRNNILVLVQRISLLNYISVYGLLGL
jgi:LmbE family N-acetylglucosaminyl deacetylase